MKCVTLIRPPTSSSAGCTPSAWRTTPMALTAGSVTRPLFFGSTYVGCSQLTDARDPAFTTKQRQWCTASKQSGTGVYWHTMSKQSGDKSSGRGAGCTGTIRANSHAFGVYWHTMSSYSCGSKVQLKSGQRCQKPWTPNPKPGNHKPGNPKPAVPGKRVPDAR
jgi:hypothetical protein